MARCFQRASCVCACVCVTLFRCLLWKDLRLSCVGCEPHPLFGVNYGAWTYLPRRCLQAISACKPWTDRHIFFFLTTHLPVVTATVCPRWFQYKQSCNLCACFPKALFVYRTIDASNEDIETLNVVLNCVTQRLAGMPFGPCLVGQLG